MAAAEVYVANYEAASAFAAATVPATEAAAAINEAAPVYYATVEAAKAEAAAVVDKIFALFAIVVAILAA